MKLVIWNEETVQPEPTIYLSLYFDKRVDSIALHAWDSKHWSSDGSTLLHISPYSGTISLVSDVKPYLGFKLDGMGRVKILP